MTILLPILIMAALALIFGLGLAIAAKKFHVDIDPRLEKVNALLPGANCGACGKPGCFGFAESLFTTEPNIDACRVCEDKEKEMIAEILGKKLIKADKLTARVHCGGGKNVKDKFIYQGINDCIQANLLMRGPKSCIWGCIGLGTCVRICPFGAITLDQNNLPVVNSKLCKACNKCVAVCPKNIFSLSPLKGRVIINCCSPEIGRQVKSVCNVGCIGCKLCEKACRFDAIKVINNLAQIDYTKCTNCGACIKACPAKTIIEK